ncbi:MAG: transporter [Variovorax paradoxus]|uniref:Transporter n=1 Tax=Variovorax paradoxus TaxID=34073 RepID=A0A2W5PPV9_VARPD|nr:MAG: transporter [Variovorax paradoxus]
MTRIQASFRPLAAALAGATLVASLSGCVPLVVGGAAVAGAGMVATDRRTSGAQLDDQSIELRSAARIRDIANDTMNITTVSYNRQVLMIGTVGSEADKRRAEEVVRGTPNVRSVVNEVVVGPALGIAQRSNDTYITGKVKASLLDAKDIFANSFKVVTEGGVVYLMGLATRRELDRATDIARSVSGVQKVVRAVEIISEQQLGQGAVEGGTGLQPSAVDGTNSSGSRVPLPPLQPLPGQPQPGAPVQVSPQPQPGVVTTPVR